MEYKRKSRHLSPVTKQKISKALKGRTKPQSVRELISQSLRTYWANFQGDDADINDETV